jgi:hypothetical protein
MKPYSGNQSSIGGASAPSIQHPASSNQHTLIGSRLSARIIQATGKQPCGFCRKVRDTLDKVHATLTK